ncbi:MAG: hypothetical protein K8I00_00465, partial [Candidatus Omnitrophica bacterium]|nr:hypothetical protein [Candidatus Omnitrophota bacterium]
MRTFQKLLLSGLLVFAMCALQSPTDAADGEEFSITITPVKNVEVKGDKNKFRAHNWMDEGYAGGIKNLFFSKEYENDSKLTFEGHLLPKDNNNGVMLDYDHAEFGKFVFEYDSFRKYFDNSGGYYYPFSTLDTTDLNKELELDIESIGFSYAPIIGDQATLVLWYKHKTKDGDKSRLTWADAREGSVTREITPSYQNIDEKVDEIGIRGETTLSGFNVSAEQTYEKMDTTAIRYERLLSTNATASQKKQRIQTQQPETEILTTTFQGERWFGDDTSYFNMAYRYANVEAEELENIVEADEFGVPTNFSNAKTRVNATADNDIDSHIVVGHYMKQLTETFRVTAKSKNQMMRRKGNSTYPYDTSPAAPDGVIDAIDYSQTRDKLWLFGQNFAFQYTGIKRASIYGDIEITEMDNDINEIQRDITRALKWQRVTNAKTKKTAYTLGTRIVPSRYVNLTLQGKRKYENNDYDDDVDTDGSINSAFFDSMKIVGDELTTKITWKPVKWLQNSARYQFATKNYDTRVQGLSDTQESRFRSHTFTYDIFVQLMDNLFVNG